MIEILLGILEALEFLTDLIWRAVKAVFDASEFQNPLLAALGYVFLGGIVGGLSLLPFPHTIVHRS